MTETLEKTKGINLPTEKIKAESKSANRILMYSKPKQGKTTALSLLENSLLIDTEAGSDFVDAFKIQVDITKPDHEQAEEFMNILRAIYMKGYNATTKVYTPPYKVIIIDTYTRLDSWSEIVGTFNYMAKSQGKKFNVSTSGQRLSVGDKDFETVHEMPNGFGFRHSREVMLDWYDKICKLSPKTIFVCHTKEKLVGMHSGEAVLTKDINLTGKVKDIIASKVDTVMHCFREGNKLMVNFSGEDGTRCSYLSGKTIILTESDDNGNIIINNWNQIFID